jgi:hypothetical protein
MRTAPLFALLSSTLASALLATPALAQRDRVFVASYGSDSNPCTFGSPCKTFQNAVDVVAQGGEVTAIDSAGFGTFTISHAVTITSPNGVEAGIAAPETGAAAVTINAESGDKVVLNGLTLDGDSVDATGIKFNSGGVLSVNDSVIRNFGGLPAIDFVPNSSSQLLMSNARILNNGNDAIDIAPTGSGTTNVVFNHVEMENNGGVGLSISTSTQTINMTVNDSVVADNAYSGITTDLGDETVIGVMVRNSVIANNGSFGLFSSGTGSTIRVSRSTLTGNDYAWGYAANGVVLSYGDNNIDGNTNDNSEPPNPLSYH